MLKIKENILECEMDLCKNKKWNANGNNVLLLSMSTLNSKNQNKYFARSVQGENYLFTAVSQLEPGTKYIITKLAKQNRRLDEIIIIATPETKKKTERKNRDGGVIETFPAAIGQYLFGINEFVSDGNKSEEYEALVKGLNNCNLEELDFSMYNAIVENVVNPSTEEQFNDNEYRIGDCKVRIINEGDENVLNQISEQLLANANDNSVNLFVDVQGGRRTFFYTMFCTTTLLRDKNVNLVELFATDFDINYEVHPIVDYTKEYAVLDLVSGIRTFTSYGKSKELNTFLENRDIKYGENGEKSIEADLINNLRRIDQSLSINDPTEIKKQFSILKKSPLIAGDMSLDNVDPQFALIVDDIKRTYGSLLTKYGTNYIDLIKWLVNKDFITQALTMVEDKIPGELIYKVNSRDSLKRKDKYIWIIENKNKCDWNNKYKIAEAIGGNAQKYYKAENNILNTLLFDARVDEYKNTVIEQIVSDMYNKPDLTNEINCAHWKKLLNNLLDSYKRERQSASEVIDFCAKHFGTKHKSNNCDKYEAVKLLLSCVYGTEPSKIDEERKRHYDLIQGGHNDIANLHEYFKERNISELSDVELIKYSKTFEWEKEINDSKNKKIVDDCFGIRNEELYTIIPKLKEPIESKIIKFDGKFGKTYASLKKQNRTEKGFQININEKKKDCIEMIEAILLLYRALKNERNTTNHASENIHMEYEYIKMGILVLAEMVDRVQNVNA